ncbi:putative tegument protein [Pseudomonas phage MR6]|nr:putative tegument protein [Pseudomonas phage MR6]
MTQLTKLQQMQALAAQNATIVEVDMSETSSGGGGARRLLPGGMAMAQLVRYIEFGKHAREYQGQAKTPAMVVRMGVALWGDTDPLNPLAQSERPETLFHTLKEDGTVTPTILNSFDLTIGNNEKSKTKIIFDRLNWRKDSSFKNFAQFLGHKFLVPILSKVGKPKDGKPGQPYNEIDWKNLLPPFDQLTRQPYPIPEAPDDSYQMFLWDSPTKECWDTLFIEGTNDKTGKSKNFLQAKCLEAVNFRGSALEVMLGGVLPDLTGGVERDSDPDDTNTQAPAADPATSVPAVPGVPVNLPSVPTTLALPDVPFDGGVATTLPVAETAHAVTVAPVVETPAVTLPAMPAIPTL